MRIFIVTYRDMKKNQCEAHFISEHLARNFVENSPYDDIDKIYSEVEI